VLSEIMLKARGQAHAMEPPAYRWARRAQNGTAAPRKRGPKTPPPPRPPASRGGEPHGDPCMTAVRKRAWSKGLNMCGRRSGEMPTPVSATEMRALSQVAVADILTDLGDVMVWVSILGDRCVSVCRACCACCVPCVCVCVCVLILPACCR
jgi:hypothetical protein